MTERKSRHAIGDKAVSAELVRLREESGLSRERVAAGVGYSAKSIERWEKGSRARPEAVRKLRAFYRRVGPDAGSLGDVGGLDSYLDPDVALASAEATNGPEARKYLAAFREQLHGQGASADEEEAAVMAIRWTAIGAGLTNADDVLDAFEDAGRVIAQYFTHLRTRRYAEERASELVRQHPPMVPFPKTDLGEGRNSGGAK